MRRGMAGGRRRRAFGHPVALRTGLWGGVQSLGQTETTGLLVLALLIGLGSGLGAVGFRKLIDLFHAGFFGAGHLLVGSLGMLAVIIVPAFGGLFVGPIVYFFAREAKGHGVPEVIAAIALNGGRIRPRVVIVKALASAITIGSGGSVGREGPIVQIGSALGSTLGQVFHMSEARIRLLLACGAAGGIAATFNAPLAGVFFALEVILAEFETRAFSMIVISSVLAAVTGRVFFGNHPAFQVPSYQFVSPFELLPYAVLGVLAGLLAVVFIRVLYGMEDLWDRWTVPEYLKPIPGGLVMGIVGLLAYHFQTPSPAGASDSYLFGVGYNGIEPALFGRLAWQVMLFFLVLKLAAVSITIASGGSGGVFSPALFLGAMLGGAFGSGVHVLFPTWSAWARCLQAPPTPRSHRCSSSLK